MNPDIAIIGVAVLAFLSIAGLGFVFVGGDGAAVSNKRVRQVAAQENQRGKPKSATDLRRKQTEASLKALRAQADERRAVAKPKTLKAQIEQAGLSISPAMFWIGSILLGVGVAAALFIAGAPPFAAPAVGFVAAFGLPRWILGFLKAGRMKKFGEQFVDALDVIVRGVKSGLPLNDCLKVIATDSPDPLRGEFARMADNLAMGMQLDRALQKLFERVPLPEVNFFAIVLAIQQKAGGNLSEALGNLSTVIRSRKMLREKVKALSAEAKASAMIIGSLPIAVMGMVYVTTPSYIMELFTDPTGHMILLAGGVVMGLGIFIMRKMINFDM